MAHVNLIRVWGRGFEASRIPAETLSAAGA